MRVNQCNEADQERVAEVIAEIDHVTAALAQLQNHIGSQQHCEA